MAVAGHAQIKISALPAATNAADADLAIIVQSNVTKRVAVGALRSGLQASNVAGLGPFATATNLTSTNVSDFAAAALAAAPPTTNAAALTAGTLDDARIGTNIARLAALPAWSTAADAGAARTNLGIPWAGLTNASAETMRPALGLGVSDTVTFSNIYIGQGSLSYGGTTPEGFRVAVRNTNVLTFTAESATFAVPANATSFRAAQGGDSATLAATGIAFGGVAAGATRTNLGLGPFATATNLASTNIADFAAAALAAAPPTTNAGALAAGTLADARLSTNVARVSQLAATNIAGLGPFATATNLSATNIADFAAAALAAAPPTTNAAALAAGTLADARLSTNVPLLGANNLWAGTNQFDRVNIGGTNYGWTLNTNGGGQMEIRFPGGTAAFYETGNPPAPYMYFAGTIQADYLIGAISGVTINASGLSGEIPSSVIGQSMSTTVGNWLAWPKHSQAAGVAWSNTGPLTAAEPVPPGAYYFPAAFVTDGGADCVNSLDGVYLTATNAAAALVPGLTNSALTNTFASFDRATNSFTGSMVVGDAAGDSMTINAGTVSAPNATNISAALSATNATATFGPVVIASASSQTSDGLAALKLYNSTGTYKGYIGYRQNDLAGFDIGGGNGSVSANLQLGGSIFKLSTAGAEPSQASGRDGYGFIINGCLSTKYLEKGTNYTANSLAATINCSNAITITLPSAVNFAGRIYTVKNSGTNTVTVATTSSQTIDASTNYVLASQWSKVTVQSTGANWIIIGD